MMNRRAFLTRSLATTAGAAAFTFVPQPAIAQSTAEAPVWEPTYWWWWVSWVDWQNSMAPPEEEIYARNDGSSGGFLTNWPDPDDETNYTFFTEDILRANIGNYFASGGAAPSFNTCKFLDAIGIYTLGQLRAWLIANPEVLEEVAFIMDVAPAAVLIMGVLLVIALIAIAAYC
jgi:hypothetical protein